MIVSSYSIYLEGSMSIILGIDPGSRITGYGVIHQNRHHLYYLGSGCIRTSEKALPERLKQIYAAPPPPRIPP